MKRWFAVLTLLLGASLPAFAQLQYFGYVGADDANALRKTKSYTNFVHVAAEAPQDAPSW